LDFIHDNKQNKEKYQKHKKSGVFTLRNFVMLSVVTGVGITLYKHNKLPGFSRSGGFNVINVIENALHGKQQGGYPQGGFPQQGFQQGGFPQQGFQQGGFQQGGFPQQGFQQGGFPQQQGMQQGHEHHHHHIF
jgi:hypothetical protein